MADEKRKQVNIDFSSDPELLKTLDRMAKDDGMNRSQFIRKLVRQEQKRRDQPQLPLPEKTNRRKSDAHAAQAHEIAVAV